MRITFNLISCGLGNNGGSHTLVRSANTLYDLGHQVVVVDSGRNKHSWTPLRVKHIVVKKDDQVPDSDFIIATGYTTVKSTLSLPSRCGKKVHWIRAYESWKMSEKEIVDKVLSIPTIKLVNSLCLQKQLQKFDIKSEVVRPGYDFDEIYPLGIRRSKKEIVVGALYNEGRKRTTKRVDWCFSTVDFLKRTNKNVKFYMFGTEGTPKSLLVDFFVKNPTLEQKNLFYNKCDIWLAPTELEGLHIPPAESMLTECAVVGTCAPMNGMQDYLENGKTGVVSKNKLSSFIESTRLLVEDEKTRKLLGCNGRQSILKLGSRQYNMEKLVEFLCKKD